jgi:two-component system, NtrC family, nitrogen regulation response regulator GlnG
MTTHPDFLLLEEDPFLGRKLSSVSQTLDFFCVVANNTRQGRMHLEIHGRNLRMAVITLNGTDPDRVKLIEDIRKKYPQLPLLLAAAPDLLSQAAGLKLRLGLEYILKPFELDAFQSVVSRIASGAASASPAPSFPQNSSPVPLDGPKTLPVLLGSSPAILEVFEKLERIADNLAPILIHGARGTGKSLVAELVHASGRTKFGGKVTLNCAAYANSTDLLEALVGRQGPGEPVLGALAQIPGGTLVLENIDAAAVEVQATLLQLLELGTYRPLNANLTQKAAPRLFCTTTADLTEKARLGQIREDFYFRISECPIYLPPLAERKSDIPILARRFIRRRENPEILGFSEECWEQFAAYPWPGNVTELAEVVQQCVTNCSRGYIQPQHLPALLEASESQELRELRSQANAALGSWLTERVKCRPATYDSILQELESMVLQHLLGRFEKKPTFLAEALSMNRNTLRKKLEISGLNKRQNRKLRPSTQPSGRSIA